MFIAKGFSWFIEDEKTRIRNVNGVLQQSTLDQVFANNNDLVNNVEITAPLGKSDHVGMMVEVNSSTNLDYVTTKRKNFLMTKCNHAKSSALINLLSAFIV